VSAGGDTEWVDRAPRQSPAMKAAYAGLAEAEDYVAQCHADEDWEAHREAISIMVDWHREIGCIAQGGK
jgi:leucyl aminopeptidase (aminopeptidase T)